jgi:putative acetyltransferase
MNPSLQIRPIEPNDNKPLAEVIRSVFREFKVDRPGTVYTDPTTDHLYELFQTPGSEYFVALKAGNVIGGCGFFPTDGLPDGCVELVKFFLLPEARGKGLGFTLMEKSMDAARAQGYTQMYLESFPELAKAVSMYERTGFKHINHALGNSGHHACNIWMVKDL